MSLTGIGTMGYKLVATQFTQSTRGFATSLIMRTELLLCELVNRYSHHFSIDTPTYTGQVCSIIHRHYKQHSHTTVHNTRILQQGPPIILYRYCQHIVYVCTHMNVGRNS